MEEYKLHLNDLIDTALLQKIQDAFSDMTGLAALTTDENGVPVTHGSNFSDFCMKYTRESTLGCSRCEQCDKYGAEMALEKGKSILYSCHAGLIDFAAPIKVQNKLIGCFIGGQVLTAPPDLDQIRQYADEIGVDPDEYLDAAKQVNIMELEKIDKSARFLYVFADILSDIIYSRHLVFQANKELGLSVNMKSDFLANMSHEIRTPMNAVVGMADMALREDLPDVAREYINQIKIASKSLLTIINDILDFSKIESGKLDINIEEYEPMSIINDVSNIVMTRLRDKDVELILDISPDLPYKLLGDSIRIKQIILNLANNAAKFTNFGSVTLKMEYTKLSDDEIELCVSVKDTGIGIKSEDMDKLFQSFSQVDSKRNRNIEGTGLGLAICKQLLTLMNGNISVESEYNKGSKFSFVLPQKIVDSTPSIVIQNANEILALSIISNPYIADALQHDMESLGIEHRKLHSTDELFLPPKDKNVFLFVDQNVFSKTIEEFVQNNPEITAISLIDVDDTADYTIPNIPNLLIVKKPLFMLNLSMILNNEDLHAIYNTSNDINFDFIAPDAEVLIVDDNAINLTVAEGLLQPLKMKIDTALSGKEAIRKVDVQRYDIIFMDHMMPEVDGVETTHIIRTLHPEYDNVPIIALTANAVNGTKELFCKEGMNDFVAKPIELRVLISKVKKWLPKEKIQKINAKINNKTKAQIKDIAIGDLNTSFAIKSLGNEQLFWSVLKEYYRVIEKKADLIKSLEEQEDWSAYTIEVHALKSASKQIGAMSLSDKAAAMEKAGNAKDSEMIHKCTDEMLEQYLGYLPILQPFCEEEEETDLHKETASDAVLHNNFEEMQTAIEDLDMDQMENVIHKMSEFSYEGWQQELFSQLKDAVADIDVDACEAIIQNWESKM